MPLIPPRSPGEIMRLRKIGKALIGMETKIINNLIIVLFNFVLIPAFIFTAFTTDAPLSLRIIMYSLIHLLKLTLKLVPLYKRFSTGNPDRAGRERRK